VITDGDARQAQVYNCVPRPIPTGHEVQRAYRRILTAYMAPWMPTANAWTREITAIILASHGLLDETPARKPPAEGRHRHRLGRRKAGRDDDGRFS
jgi:hypothetical protein